MMLFDEHELIPHLDPPQWPQGYSPIDGAVFDVTTDPLLDDILRRDPQDWPDLLQTVIGDLIFDLTCDPDEEGVV
jgi:hypothetical protein